MSDFIRLEGITKRFGNNVVLNNLDINIPREGITGIVGLSGCGKTTLLNLLVGYWNANAGRIIYNGIDITKRKNVVEHLFGFATQEGAVYPHLTTGENLEYFGAMHNMGKGEIIARREELLKLLELKNAENVLADELSTGMFRRLDIACSLMHSPQILILDEPTGNLDPVLRKKILAMVKKISDSGTKVILTSHLLGEVEKICDEIAILHNGRILDKAHPEKLKERYSKNQLVCLETNTKRYAPLITLAKQFGASNVMQKNGSLYIYIKEPEALLYSLAYYIKKYNEKIQNIEVSRPSIEEVFESATRS